MNRKILCAMLVAMIAIGVLAAGHLAFWDRYQLEKDYKQVELLMDYNDIKGMNGPSELATLQTLKQHGLTTVLFKEQTVADIEGYGYGTVLSGSQLMVQSNVFGANPWLAQLIENNSIKSENTYLIFTDKQTFERVASQLSVKIPHYKTYTDLGETYLIETVLTYSQLQDIGIGFPQDKLQLVEQAGLNTMVQVRTWPKVTVQGLETVFAPIKRIPNLTATFFNDGVIPGVTEDLLPEVAQHIRETPTGATATIEFFPQSGINKLAVLLDKQVVRLHTIGSDEISKNNPSKTEVIDRFSLAAAERNHRAILVRPLVSTGGEDPLTYYGAFLDDLQAELQKEGLSLGVASKFPPNPVSKAVVLLVGVGVIGGGLLLLNRLGFGKWLTIIGVASLVAWAGLLYLMPDFGRKLMALASVIIFPTLSVLTFTKQQGLPLSKAVLRLVQMSLFSLIGALLMVGLLADVGFMLKLDQFVGIKLAHVVPLGIGVVYFVYLASTGNSIKERLADLLNKPIVVSMAAVAGLLLVAVAIYVMRTGNEGPTVSSLELTVRTALDNLLGVRPRTKEFLLGHPAMLALLYFGYRNNWFIPLLVLGIIGQVSLVNTFAHIHTPLVVSLIRFGHGLWIGLLIGVAAIVAYRLLEKQVRRYL
ncbi:DUF5693 family protein [Peptococcaceae bacterium 1198_IL3148]